MKEELTKVSDTLIKGRITELKAITFFLERGYIVSIPEIPCQYDFLLDVNGKIYKIQVKTSRISSDGGYISFNTSSMTHNSEGYTKRLYSEQMVDYFCTFYNNQCYLVPLKDCGSKEKRLRLLPTKNGQTKNINFAKDFLAEEVLKNSE